jgi:hypothetical protein
MAAMHIWRHASILSSNNGLLTDLLLNSHRPLNVMQTLRYSTLTDLAKGYSKIDVWVLTTFDVVAWKKLQYCCNTSLSD